MLIDQQIATNKANHKIRMVKITTSMLLNPKVPKISLNMISE